MHFIQTLATLVKDHLESNVACSQQMALRCPMCVNPTCGRTKEFFAGNQVVLDALRDTAQDEIASRV